MQGKITLQHQDGVAEYAVTRAEYGFIDDKLYVEIDGMPVGDHPLAFLGKMSIELNGAPLSEAVLRSGSGKTLSIPTSDNSDVDSDTDRFTNLYVGEHYDIDENEITVSGGAEAASIRWSGIAPDPRYYDDRAKPTCVIIKAMMSTTLFNR